jgi:tRNA1Val (adenine37-N6)-methyltransferase
MVLIEAVKGAKTQLTVEKPLVVYQKNGNYTEQLLKMYEE